MDRRKGLMPLGRVALVGLLMALAGCSDVVDEKPDAPAQDPPATPATMTIAGIVQDLSFLPVAGATVTVLELNQTARTATDGTFTFTGLDMAFYTVRADAADMAPQTLTARPGQQADLLFTLAPVAEKAYHQTVPFQGIIRCAAEYVIITPSCDTLVEYTSDTLEENGLPGLPDGGNVVDDEAQFPLTTDGPWATIVVDVVFDARDHPGIDGLRAVVQGGNDPSELGSYDQYGRFTGQSPFSFRLEPGEAYPEGDAPVPENVTGLLFNIYPQSHGWHATCEPPVSGPCFLGLGAAVDLEFELFVTAFYVDPAPDGWSLL